MLFAKNCNSAWSWSMWCLTQDFCLYQNIRRAAADTNITESWFVLTSFSGIMLRQKNLCSILLLLFSFKLHSCCQYKVAWYKNIILSNALNKIFKVIHKNCKSHAGVPTLAGCNPGKFWKIYYPWCSLIAFMEVFCIKWAKQIELTGSVL